MFHLREQFLFTFNEVVDFCIVDSHYSVTVIRAWQLFSATNTWTFDR